MDTLGVTLIILVMVSFLVGVVSLIVLIVMALAKKKLKVPGIITGAAFGGAALFLVAAFIVSMIATSGNSSSDTATNTELPASSENANDDDEVIPKRKTSTDEEDTEYDKNLKEIREEREKDEDKEDLSAEDLDEEVVEEVSEEVEESTPEVNPEDLSNYRTDYDIKDIERNPAEYKNELLYFEGKIIQVMEDEIYTAYRIAINDDYDRIAYVQTLSLTLEERLLEDDYVTVYAVFDDLLTYETVLGANQTVPAFIAHGERIVLNQ